MNKGDAFILDLGSILYVWLGDSCSRTERLKAMELARSMRDDRGKGNIEVVEDGEENADVLGADEFEVCTVSVISSLYTFTLVILYLYCQLKVDFLTNYRTSAQKNGTN